MRLPFSIELGYFNHVLSTALSLSAGQDSCDIRILVQTCEATVYDGRYVKYSEIIKLAMHANLIEAKKGRVKITNSGKFFLGQNPDLSFELSSGQQYYFATELVLNGPWNKATKRLLNSFIPNYNDVTFEFPISGTEGFNSNLRAALHLLWVLGVLKKTKNAFIVSPDYVKHVNIARSSIRKITQLEVEALIERNRENARKAEEYVVEFEKERLRTLGRYAEADRVVRVSELEANAGYDIKSFNGETQEVFFSRFIEVKSSKHSSINFFWSINEIETASKLRDSYWIYFIGDFNGRASEELNPILFQDPKRSIMTNPAFKVSASEYRVNQIITFG